MQHKSILPAIFLGLVFFNAQVTGQVGINTNTPGYTLDARDAFSYGHFKASAGNAGIIIDKTADNQNNHILYRTNGLDMWNMGTIGNRNFRINNYFAGGTALAIDINNNFLGVGTSDPAFRLDVAGRIRLRAGNESAGLWLNNLSNTAAMGFIGAYTDNRMGFWGNTGIGWGLIMNTDNGYLGIRADPVTELHVRHLVGSGSVNGFRLNNSGVNNQEWTLYVVNSTENLELFHNGTTRGIFNEASGVYTAVSDTRFKKNIQKSGLLLDNILKLDVKRYQFINSQTDRNYYGMIAQEVEKLFPEIVFHNQGDDGSEYYTMDYSAMGVIAIKGIQELKPTIDRQQGEIAALHQQNERLKQELVELKQVVDKLVGHK